MRFIFTLFHLTARADTAWCLRAINPTDEFVPELVRRWHHHNARLRYWWPF